MQEQKVAAKRVFPLKRLMPKSPKPDHSMSMLHSPKPDHGKHLCSRQCSATTYDWTTKPHYGMMQLSL